MRTRHKGQGSAEYLILLAMAMVLMLILVAVMGGFDGALSGANEAESSVYWEGSARPFSIAAGGQHEDTLYINVVNMDPEQLFLRKIVINNVTADLEPGWSWRPGATKTVSIPDLPMCGVGGYDSYAYNVSFVYDTGLLGGYRQTGGKPLLGHCG